MSASKSARKFPKQKISIKMLEAVITRGQYSFLPVSKSLSLKQFVKAYKAPCYVVTQSHFSSFLGTVSLSDKQILAIREVKQAKVIYSSCPGGEDFTVPVSCTDVLFAPLPLEGMSKMCMVGELLASKSLPAVILPEESFTDANGREVDSGTHLFLPGKPKATLFRNTRKTLKAMSSDGQVVIDAKCESRFCTRKIGLSLQEIADHLPLPIQVKPISSDEDLNGVPHLNLNEVVMEDIIVATVKFDGRMQSSLMEIPSSFNVGVVVLQPIATQEVVRLIEMADIDQAAVGDLKKRLEDLVPPPLPEKGDALLRSLAPKSPPPQRRDSSSSLDSSPEPKCETAYSHPQETVKPGNEYVSKPMHGRGWEPVRPPTLQSRPPPTARALPKTPMPSYLPKTEPFTGSAHSAGYQPKSGDYMDLERSSMLEDNDGYCTITMATGMPNPTSNPWGQLQRPQAKRDSVLPSKSMPLAATATATPPTLGAMPPDESSFVTYDTMSLSSSSQYGDINDENIEYLKSLSCIRVLHLLESMHLECYCEAFRNEQIDGEVLSSLDDEMLVELGVKSSLHRMRLTKVIKGVLSVRDNLEGNTLSV